MSCREQDDGIVELARGAELEPHRLREVRAHLGGCASCRSRFEEQRALTEGLGALAKAADRVRASRDLESRLLDAFHAQHAPATGATVETSRGGASRPSPRTWAIRAGLAAAAMLVLAVIPAWLLEPPPPKPKPPVPKVAAVREAPPPLPPSAVAPPAVASPGVRPAPVVTRSRRQARPDAGILRPADFVSLPGALGLPDFESGVIARVQLPLTSLPNYGIPIAPDAARSTVPADILFGQDGLARAIRLVRTSADTRSAQ
jgi:hypothetical protein